MRRVFKSLRSRLIALILIAMLPMLAISWFIGMQLYRHAVDDVYQNSTLLVQRISLEQEKHIVAAEQLLVGLSTSPAMIERRPGFCSVFQDLLAQQAIYANAGMTDIDGNVICSAVPKTSPVSFSDRVWYREVRKGNGAMVGDYHLGVMMKEPVAIVAKPILGKGGEHLAYLFASVDLSWFNRHTLGDKLPMGAELIFYDNKGVILHREPEPDIWRGRSIDTAIRKIGTPDPETGVVEAYGGDGVSRLFSYARLKTSAAEDNAIIAVGIPADTALAQARHIGGLATLVILGVFGGLLLFAWIGTGRLVIAPVRRLIQQANAHAAGDLSQRSGMAQDSELGQLGHALDEMAIKLEKHRDDLAQHIRALNEHAIVSAADTEGNIVYANDKFCEISQYAREEVIGKNHRVINSGLHLPEFFNELWTTISQGKVWHGNVRNRRRDGSVYWVASTIVPFLNRQGLPERYLSIRTDITQALAIDAALKESEVRFRLLAENSLDVISLRDLEGRYTYISPSCQRVLGYAPDELIGHSGYEFVHPDDIETVRERLHQPALRGDEAHCEYYRLRHKSGEYIWVEASSVPIRDEDGHIIGGQISARNVTARKQAEDELRLHDRAIAASGSGIVIFRRDDLRIVYANTAYSHMVGLPEADIAGQFWPVFAQAAGDADKWKRLADAVDSGDERHATVEAISYQGLQIWCDIFISPVRTEAGSVTHYVASISDMTQHAVMEQALLRAKEVAEQASHAKSKFLSHVSHELRTPLNSIVGFAQLLESDPQAPLNEEQQDSIERILHAGWMLRDLINDVLDLSRIESGRLELKPVDTDMFDLVSDCLQMIARQAAEKGLEIVNLVGECPQRTMYIDAKRFKQVLFNLLSNAVKYNRNNGRVTVLCRRPNDNIMQITVSDTGIGIPLEKRGELFQYFSRLDAENSSIPGVGVGLALCRHLVELMGGSINVESVPEEGSSFTIELPVVCCLPETDVDAAEN